LLRALGERDRRYVFAAFRQVRPVNFTTK
jgi:hypothetical protein